MKQTTTAFRYRRLLRYLPAFIWMVIIYVLSSRTSDEISTLLPLLQKWFPFMQSFNWGHFVSYFILAMTIDYGIGRKADRYGMKVIIVLLCGLYGISDEYHQSFVGGRTPELLDIRNDLIGAALWTAFSAIHPVRKVWRRIAK